MGVYVLVDFLDIHTYNKFGVEMSRSSSKSNVIYPFSLVNTSVNQSLGSGRKKDVGVQQHRNNSVSSAPNNYSIEINDQDKEMKCLLRSNSLIGEAQHPFFHQCSNGRVRIPVEHVQEDEFVATSTIAKPEHVGTSETNRKRDAENLCFEPFKPLDESERNQLQQQQENFDPLPYDPTKYEGQWSIKNDPTLNSSAVSRGVFHSDVNKCFVKDFQKLSFAEMEKENKEDEFKIRDLKEEARKEHELEIKNQDEYMEKNISLQRFLIIPDGNCLYRAIAQSVLLDQTQHMMLRQLALDHIREHKDEFKNIIEGDIDNFLAAAELEGEWAGYPEIMALSRLLEINVNITTGGTLSNPNVRLRLHHFGYLDSDLAESSDKESVHCTDRQSIWLSWLSNGHYDAFVEGHPKNPEYEDWLRSRESGIERDAAIASQLYLDDANEWCHLENVPRYKDLYPSSKAKESSRRSPVSSNQNKSSGTLCDANINKVLFPESNPMRDYASNAYPVNYSSAENSRFHTSVYDHVSDSALAPHEYPAATYGRRARTEEPLPSYSAATATDTALDEALARTLYDEEVQERNSRLQQYGFHYL